MPQYTLDQIENIAELVQKQLNVTDDTVIDVVDIAKELGFNVYTSSFTKNNISGMVVSSTDEKAIYVAEDEFPQRQRFTISHEIGHIILHHDIDTESNFKIVDYRGANNNFDRKEYEANAFAAALLMPKEKAKTIWKKLNDIDDFASTFKVSKMAASIRLQNLGLI